MDISLGVANSVSANFDYDPLDAHSFAEQYNFNSLEVFVTEKLLLSKKTANELCRKFSASADLKIFLRAGGFLNPEWLKSDYAAKFFQFVDELGLSSFIINFDEKAALEEVLTLIEKISEKEKVILLENFYQNPGLKAAEKNMRKYLALFTLANSHGHSLKLAPVLNIPHFFNESLELSSDSALSWCFQMINYFGNRRIPLIFHLIDAREKDQHKNYYCPIGEGNLPYQKIFDFIKKTRPVISEIILQFEDKMNSLKSKENILELTR